MVKHIIQMSVLTIAAIAFIFYPFLPGIYDNAALGLSTVIQLFEVVGLLLVPLGLAWMFYEVRKQARSWKYFWFD